mmetsp:Transcript_46581/g.110374  ORF Transcript_46581/g.110374 Transcript_46581/m.110374 type:complete len:122 (+) Transcript_46581:114-479(+)
MNIEKPEDLKRATLVARHLADCKDLHTQIALSFALNEPVGKSYHQDEVQCWILSVFSDEEKAEFKDQVCSYERDTAWDEGTLLSEDEQLAYAFKNFLSKKYLVKIEKKVSEYEKFLEELHA